LRRCGRLLGLSRKNAKRYLKPTAPRELSHYWRQVSKTVWLPSVGSVRAAYSQDNKVVGPGVCIPPPRSLL
jgi:hypothetical protein